MKTELYKKLQKICFLVLTRIDWNGILRFVVEGNTGYNKMTLKKIEKSFKKLLTERTTYDIISELPLRTATQNLDK